MEAVATKKTIKFKVNGKEHTLEVGANETLAKVLRERTSAYNVAFVHQEW